MKKERYACNELIAISCNTHFLSGFGPPCERQQVMPFLLKAGNYYDTRKKMKFSVTAYDASIILSFPQS
jgi:hypothetical protein